MQVDIRPLAAEDYADLGRIFFCAVHEGTKSAYCLAQRLAWGGETIDLPLWKARAAELTGFVAQTGGEPVGFISMDRAGYVGFAYVLPSAAGKGVGTALLSAAEAWARGQGAASLTTEASLIARPFFLRGGWVVVEEEEVERKGVTLTRFRMRKEMV